MSNDLILSLGSNIEPKLDFLKNTVSLLNEKFNFKTVSSLYQTDPLDFIDQDFFYNICIWYKTEITDPFEILRITQHIEQQVGKKKKNYNGPRKVDIDIIFFGDNILKKDELFIPHKRMFFRKFVLVPILEILPVCNNYRKKYQLEEQLKKIENQNIKRIGDFKIG